MSRSTKRDLRSGVPVWLAHEPKPLGTAALQLNEAADVVVGGGGVSGVLVADALLQAGLTTIAVDRLPFVEGSTPPSSALLQVELDESLTKLQETIGAADDAARAYWRSASAVEYLRGRIVDLGLRCGFHERETVYLPGGVLESAGLPPGKKRTFAVMGYGGNGITFSAVAAQLIQRAVMGLEDPDADLFAFNR